MSSWFQGPDGCERRQIGFKVLESTTLMRYNGQTFDKFNQDESIDVSKNPVRPKAISFKFSNDGDVERVQQFVLG